MASDPVYRGDGDFRHGCLIVSGDSDLYQAQCICGWVSPVCSRSMVVHEAYAAHISSPLVRKFRPLSPSSSKATE
jgi:hypothetical protein